MSASDARRDHIDLLRRTLAVVGEPSAVAGRSLAVLRGWLDVAPPMPPQFVAPSTRHPHAPAEAAVRRVERWEQLAVILGPEGIPCLGTLDGVITLAAHCEDGELHTVVQALAYGGELDVAALMRRRRTGLPGSARIGRVGAHYLLGLDSPQEVEAYRVLRAGGIPPQHLNVWVRTPNGVTIGPFDGYDEVGAAYEVDGIHHTEPARIASDARKGAAAETAEIELVRFFSSHIAARTPMLEAWWATRAAAADRGAGPRLRVLHAANRGCPCGHRPRGG